MRARSVIEIVESDGRLPAQLIVAGYWASQAGLVIFILNGVTAQMINLVLDPIVNTLPLSIPGVLYVDIKDEARVNEAVLSAEKIYAASRAFRRLANYHGVARGIVQSATRAIPKLESHALRQSDSGVNGRWQVDEAQKKPAIAFRTSYTHTPSKPPMSLPVAVLGHLEWRAIDRRRDRFPIPGRSI
ncbi:hypothetical protein [Sinorhizobium fredii]|uniref:Uncharacterized protein n=1 Tax=Rhizobium fredii TaxID=380 RepID=A0A2A6M6Y6_RHIFR|nr:hypothetical protein [Sinorhizobium fredii]PDT50574.1 hypothetical protein CO661_02215 [Sinorhizobium fredii]